MITARIVTIGPEEWGVFDPEWYGGQTPLYRGTLLECIAYRRKWMF